MRLLDPADPQAPKYWMYETTGVLRPAVEAYLQGGELTQTDIAAMRAYLRQWIDSPVWVGVDIFWLRATVRMIHNRHDIDEWLHVALSNGLDPL